MPIVDGTHVRISGIGPPLPRRVRHHHFRFLANVVVALAQRDRIPVALRHLPPVKAGYARRLCEHRLWLSETRREIEKFGFGPQFFEEVLYTGLLSHPSHRT